MGLLPSDTLMAKMVPPPRAMAIQSLVSRGLCYPVKRWGQGRYRADPSLHGSGDCFSPTCVLCLLQELLENRFDRLNRLPLVTVTAQEGNSGAASTRLCWFPWPMNCGAGFPPTLSSRPNAESCTRRCAILSPRREGYGAGNFIHLCQQLGVSLSGANFDHLSIWQCDLRQVNLQGTNFSHAQFADTVFATALGRNPVMAFSPDGQYLATGDQEGRLLLWDMTQNKLVRVLEQGSVQGIVALAFSPETELLAVGTAGGSLWLWSMASGSYHTEILLEGNEAVLALAFSSDGRYLVAGNTLGQIDLWEIASGDRQGPWQHHQGPNPQPGL